MLRDRWGERVPNQKREKTPVKHCSIPQQTDENSEPKRPLWYIGPIWSKWKRLTIHVHKAFNHSLHKYFFSERSLYRGAVWPLILKWKRKSYIYYSLLHRCRNGKSLLLLETEKSKGKLHEKQWPLHQCCVSMDFNTKSLLLRAFFSTMCMLMTALTPGQQLFSQTSSFSVAGPQVRKHSTVPDTTPENVLLIFT